MPEEYAQEALIREFLAEAEDHLEALDRCLLDFESGVDTGAGVADSVVQDMFRAMHTVKGLAAMFDLLHIKELAHKTEGVLDRLRKGTLDHDSMVCAVLFDAVDAMRTALARVLEDDAGTAPTLEAAARVESFLATGVVGDTSGARVEGAHDEQEFTEYTRMRLGEAFAEGMNAFRIQMRWGIELRMGGLTTSAFERGVGGELLQTRPLPTAIPALADLDPEMADLALVAVVISVNDAEAISDSFGIDLRFITPISPEDVGLDAALIAPAARQEAVVETPVATGAAPRARTGDKAMVGSQQLVRIDIHRLDELMDLTGELVTTRTRLQELSTRVREELPKDESVTAMSGAVSELTSLLDTLQESVMRLRMVPVGQLFAKFPRAVRDIARELDKQIQLEVVGEETELDKRVIERIEDPLLHLIRNACDHGTESPAERVAAGKSPYGTVTLSAMTEGNNVVIEVIDDGKGLDLERIRTKAESLGFDASDAEGLADVLMMPGFSTAETITDVSGRGVGLDVVKRRTGELGGRVEVESEPGKGTVFRLRLPLTLAIVPSLLVRVQGERYAIPLAAVNEVLRVFDHELASVKGVKVLDLRGQTVPMIPLSDILGIPGKPLDGRMFAVLVSSAGHRMGLLVETLVGQQEIVVKNLEQQLGQTPGIGGATILGDGVIVPIVDIDELIRLTRKMRDSVRGSVAQKITDESHEAEEVNADG